MILKIKLVHEISSGMSYLHCLKIIHCDLKLQNILIGEQINAKVSIYRLVNIVYKKILNVV